MKNPFEGLKVGPEVAAGESPSQAQKEEKRDSIYQLYDPMVNEVLDQFIAAHRQGVWEKGSDCARRYCCHVSWFAGPKEKDFDPYDTRHTIRRRVEITLEMDGLCNPTGFKVTNYEAIMKTVRVGLEKKELIHGLWEVMK